MLSLIFWLVFLSAFYLLKLVFDSGRVLDEVRVRRRSRTDRSGESESPPVEEVEETEPSRRAA